MLEETFNKINNVISGLRNRCFTDDEIDLLAMDLRNVLLEADIPYSYVKEFLADLKQKLSLVKDKKLDKSAIVGGIIKDFFDKTLSNGSNKSINIKKNGITTIAVCGTNGVGKTSFVAKLANLLQKQYKKNVVCISFDKTRPAAQEQLQILCRNNNLDFISEPDDFDNEKTLRRAIYIIENKLADVLIVDNPGISPDNNRGAEQLQRIMGAVEFDEKILVLDSTFGQNAVDFIKKFDELVELTGFTITKTESDQKGGVFFAVKSVSNNPIYYITEGEKIDDIKPFDVKMISDAIVDGGLKKLIDAFRNSNQEHINSLLNKAKNHELNYNDLLLQLQQLVSFGKLDKVLSVLPHTRSFFNVKLSTDTYTLIKHWIAIISSMTKQERNNPTLLNMDRINRIAKGSGCQVADVLVLRRKLDEINASLK